MKLINRIFAWDKHPGIQQFVWIMHEGFTKDPITLANQTADQLLQLPKTKRCIFLWHPFGPWATDQSLRKGVSSDIGYGLDDFKATEWYRKFFQQLKLREADPYFVCIDDEDNYPIWSLSIELWNTCMQNPFFVKALPSSLRVTGETLFEGAWWVNKAKYPTLWNNFANLANYKFFDNLFYNNIKTIFPTAKFGNWLHCKRTFETFDTNGYTNINIPSVKLSMPVAYLWIGKAHKPESGRTKHPLWNSLIGALNDARSCRLKGETWPWISAPGYSGDVQEYPVDLTVKFWKVMISHLVKTGINGGIYFDINNSYSSTSDIALETFSNIDMASRPSVLEPIPWDADSINTGGLITKYSDFF